MHARYGMAALAAASLIVSACSAAPGVPQPTGSSSAGADSGELPHDGAPKVPSPVDVTKFKAAPCSVLTSQQLATLGVTAKPKEDLKFYAGPQCDWTGMGSPVGMNVVFLDNSDGLSSQYKLNKQKGKFFKFQPAAPVNGMPAVLLLVDDTESTGTCEYIVGLNDHDAITIGLTDYHGNDPCGDVRTVAQGMTKTIKAGGA